MSRSRIGKLGAALGVRSAIAILTAAAASLVFAAPALAQTAAQLKTPVATQVRAWLAPLVAEGAITDVPAGSTLVGTGIPGAPCVADGPGASCTYDIEVTNWLQDPQITVTLQSNTAPVFISARTELTGAKAVGLVATTVDTTGIVDDTSPSQLAELTVFHSTIGCGALYEKPLRCYPDGKRPKAKAPRTIISASCPSAGSHAGYAKVNGEFVPCKAPAGTD